MKVGIIGYGAFGALLHGLISRFAPSVSVRVYSSHHEPDWKTFFSLKDVAKSDAVVLAVPISAFEDMLREILPLVEKHTVIVDICTVKMHTQKALKKFASGQQYISTHPMWGPESYEKKGKEVTGLRIVMCENTIPEDSYKRLVDFLKNLGFNIVEMSADAHDKSSAQTLFLTHLIGQAVSRAGFVRTDIDTVSFGYLMDAVESVRQDKKLFQDVFRYNPYCKAVLKKFGVAEREVQKILAKK